MGSGLWHFSYYIPRHPETTGLKEWWDEHLMSQLWFQLEDSALKGWGSVVQNRVCAVNQGPWYSVISLIARTHRSQSQRGAVGASPFIITQVIHSTHKILFPIIRNLNFTPLEVLGPKAEKLPPEGKKNGIKTNTKWIRNWEPPPLWLTMFLVPLNQQTRKED